MTGSAPRGECGVSHPGAARPSWEPQPQVPIVTERAKDAHNAVQLLGDDGDDMYNVEPHMLDTGTDFALLQQATELPRGGPETLGMSGIST